ncbi:MAG: 50S ribosomal protein L24 [Omnitrophica WOR_2 bacterium GWA2_47_8]|nr:MAG: 50S ribosomal protein L24 [Omnitrophica WOR_2 bacterium GWA2_47_8]
MRIRKDDKVIVMTGKDKGKTGKVLHVYPKKERALVEGLNFIKKAKRRTQQDQTGGIVEKEALIHISNLMLVDKKSNKPTRFSVKVLKDGTKERAATLSGETI